MPTVEIDKNDLITLLGKKLSTQEIKQGIIFAKSEVDSIEGNTFHIEVKDTNRPDLWGVEGIVRELRGHYKIREGLPKFKTKKSDLVVNVDKKVNKIRPKTVCGVVKNLKFNDAAIKQIIQLQEKVSRTYGRNRKKAAIGVYDYDRIEGPIKYTTVGPRGIKFVPLEFDKEMTPKEILEKHPKGQEYGHLLKGKKEYPLFIDSNKNVLSLPPIINSDYTGKVDGNTKNVFIEVTGHNLNTISLALNVIVTALYERGGKIESVDVKYGKKTIATPDLKPKEMELNPDHCRKILGLDISDKEIKQLLKKSRMKAKKKGKKIKVKYPAYRNDLMHERDLIEEVAIEFGYNDIEPEEPEIFTIGKENEIEQFCSRVRDICTGLGLQEIMTYMLSNKEKLFDKMNIKKNNIAEIENPISVNWCVFRNSLIPGCLEFLSNNKHVEYPHNIFEIGNIISIDPTAENKTKDGRNLCTLLSDNKINYQKAVSYLDSLIKNLGIKYKLKKTKDNRFIEGRCASVSVGNKKIGIIGEIHPQVLENFGLEMPCVGFEINLDSVME